LRISSSTSVATPLEVSSTIYVCFVEIEKIENFAYRRKYEEISRSLEKLEEICDEKVSELILLMVGEQFGNIRLWYVANIIIIYSIDLHCIMVLVI
jgi:hypothetical protein